MNHREQRQQRVQFTRYWSSLLVASCLLNLPVHASEPRMTSDVVSGEAIEKALTRPKTRSIGISRGISVRQTTEDRATDHAESRPGVDLNIPFELNSSELRPEAVVQLRQLESALKSTGLAHDRFLVAGHTDARGDAEYNRQLSIRRAAAVRDFLVSSGIEPERLRSTGEGEGKLLTPDRPEDAANRRVEISNLGERP